jgi:predicted GTPase
MKRAKTIIMGAAGRDFHNFNVFFRRNRSYNVVAFTATQIPDIEDRTYPRALSGPLYPRGIPILAEAELSRLIREHRVEWVVFAYSDVSHEHVMHKASEALAAGANFLLLGPQSTMVPSRKPVIAVCATRTGSGKSQTTRRVVEILKRRGKRVVVVRHPMPYGDLARQAVQRFASLRDLERAKCTVEEQEEYEPHIRAGSVVYAGVDYVKILRRAEKEADVVLWDGGNNDFPFFRPALLIVVVDPHRAGHEVAYHPGETNLRLADVIVINKEDTAPAERVAQVRENIRRVNPQAVVIDADSPVQVDDPALIRGRRVLVIEDGPTVTHGGMSFGAGWVAARKFGAREVIDPRPYLVKSIRQVFEKYPTVGAVLPAMGYGAEQVRDLAATIEATPCDTVVVGTPVDLRRLISFAKPVARVKYELEERGSPTLSTVLGRFLRR